MGTEKVNSTLQLDWSAIKDFTNCRELYRLSHVENLDSRYQSVPMMLGTAFHRGVELFWKGHDYARCFADALKTLRAARINTSDPVQVRKLEEAVDQLPSMLSVYFGAHSEDEIATTTMVEKEFEYPINEDLSAVGKIDLIREDGPQRILSDAKTANDMNSRIWKSEYKKILLRDEQLAFYDWYLRQMNISPTRIEVECVVKPNGRNLARLEVFDLTTEIIVARPRFDQQVQWKMRSIQQFHENYLSVEPWPMSNQYCTLLKYGPCKFLDGCLNGWTEKILEKYGEREEHLEVRKNVN